MEKRDLPQHPCNDLPDHPGSHQREDKAQADSHNIHSRITEEAAHDGNTRDHISGDLAENRYASVLAVQATASSQSKLSGLFTGAVTVTVNDSNGKSTSAKLTVVP